MFMASYFVDLRKTSKNKKNNMLNVETLETGIVCTKERFFLENYYQLIYFENKYWTTYIRTKTGCLAPGTNFNTVKYCPSFQFVLRYLHLLLCGSTKTFLIRISFPTGLFLGAIFMTLRFLFLTPLSVIHPVHRNLLHRSDSVIWDSC